MRRLLIAAALLLLTTPVLAQDKAAAPETDRKVYSSHAATIGGQTFDYQAECGTLALRDEQGKPEAHIFYTAYRRLPQRPARERALTFVFNGGPGSSSVWLHMGMVGPKRVVMPDDATPARPPYRVVDNPSSLLDLTDIVCIDPPTTGYSRAAEGVKPEKFHGLNEDIAAVGRFIRAWITRYDRWESPRFLMGESYGTTRAAGLAEHLQGRYGIELAGIVLISSVLDFHTKHWGNDLAYVTILPSYTAAAWYHKKLPADLQAQPLRAVLDAAEQWALNGYATALLKGERLDAAAQAELAKQLARFTGLTPAFCTEANYRITLGRFCKELRRTDRLTVGRLDARYLGRDSDAAGDHYEYDPSMAAIQGPYSEALHHYLRAELRWESDQTYEILTGKVNPWNWGAHSHRHITNVATRLRRAMTKNPYLQVFVANGYFDLATPYFATEHTMHHMGLEPPLRGNITMRYFEAGHMMYIHGPSLVKLRTDLAAWYGKALLNDIKRTGG